MALKCHELLGGKGERIPLETEVKTEEEHCCIVLVGSLILIPPSLPPAAIPLFWLLFSSPLSNPKVLPAAERDGGGRREGTIDGRIIGNESAVATAI